MNSNNNLAIVRPRVAALLDRLEAEKPRVCFIVDATASRQPTWDLAAQHQAGMFDVAAGVGLQLQLIFYRGLNECSKSSWQTNAAALRKMMEGIYCRSGHTQIAKALRHVRNEHVKKPVAAAILISDACEEIPADIYLEAKALNTPVFLFQEGDDQSVARIYQTIAELTHGAYCAFGPGAAPQLAELLKAVAAFAAGGIAALEHQETNSARLLLTQLRGNS
jgi:hypothetical protein